MQECRDESEIYNYQRIQRSNNKFINGILGGTLGLTVSLEPVLERTMSLLRSRDQLHHNYANLVFSDYAMKMTVEDPVYFSIVLSLKSSESN